MNNKNGEVSCCDILYIKDLEEYNKQYLKYTVQVAESSQDRELSKDSIVIGTSAIIDIELDGVIGMNSGIFNNPFIILGQILKETVSLSNSFFSISSYADGRCSCRKIFRKFTK